jgi:hypothetical protein
MTRLKAVSVFLKLIFTDTKFLLKELLRYASEADKRIYFQKKYAKNNLFPLVNLTEITPGFNEEISNYTFLDGTSHTIDIAFIKALCKQYKNCNYLEIGSWRGESLFNIAQVAEKCVSISFSAKEVMSRFNNRIMADSIGLFTKNIQNIKHIEADSQVFNFESLNEKFDVIFVDGDHKYEGVKSDTINAFKMLKDDNSIIIFHDCGFSFEDNRYEVIAGIIDGTPAEKRKNLYRVSNTLCGLYINKSLKTLNKTIPQFPNTTFKIDITALPLN